MTDRATRILLVDGLTQDMHWVQELIAELEENRFSCGWRHGIEILPVERLADAIKILEYPPDAQQVDAILLNPHLPDSSGLPTFIKLRNHAPHLPVVILSDTDDPDLAVSLVRAGAQDFLAKPELDTIPLARALRLAVERGRILRALQATSALDELTGLLNRNGFASAAGRDGETAHRLGLSMAVSAIEVNGIEGISRKYGRAEAQVAMIEAAEALRQAVAPAHLPLGRTGSNSFAVTAMAASRQEAETLIACIERRFAVFLHKANRGSLTFRSAMAWLGDRSSGDDLVASSERLLCENVEENSSAPAHHEHQFAAANSSNST